jgi:hypothetical protein
MKCLQGYIKTYTAEKLMQFNSIYQKKYKYDWYLVSALRSTYCAYAIVHN